ncbi:MAG TPA: FtsH protease activity modulator HflK [Kiloniellales bacterium]|nr:FtsH protease activity modulator HflK [Kiloniellales bacterium]
MPWENRGGPWGGGGGSGNGGGPWGRGGGGGGSGGSGGGPRPPDIEEFIRRGQDRFKGMLPGGGLGGGKGFLFVLLAIVLIWLFTGLYRVQPDEQGVVLMFGRWDRTTGPGLHWHVPYPIETVVTPSVERINAIDIGFRSLPGDRSGSQARDMAEESLMVTGDQNIIDIDFTVQWKIADAGRFLFNIRDPEATVKIAAESAMREIIGRTDIQPALTEAREDVQIKTRNLLQTMLNDYGAGIEITQIQLQDVKPPAAVIDAFDDVQRARQDQERLRNEAEAYRNDVLPRARGEAQRMIQEARGYRERLENEAEGEAQRFIQVYEAYKENPDVARRRMYLETMQNVFTDIDKVIMDQAGGQSTVPYLPLNELRRASRTGRSGGTSQ